MSTTPPPPTTRQDRRKAETRARIIRAADGLFQEHGYPETSIDQIADAADVAVRTIYLHFTSKASIMLSYVDDWIEAFVDEIVARPADEPVGETVRAAIAAMTAAGWTDRAEGSGNQVPHPLVDYIGAGPLDIAGHVTHRWMDAIRRMAQAFKAGAPATGHPIDPYARAFAIHTLWLSSVFAAGERAAGRAVPVDPSGVTGLAVLDRITSGEL